MDPTLTSLLAASIALVGLHFAMSHPLRPLLMKLGQGGFMAVYNIVSLAGLAWMIIAFRAAPTADLGGTGEVGWAVATLLTLPAIVLWLGAMTPRNPALPTPGAGEAARAAPTGVFAVSRHPMMWAFAIWAVSHIVLWWSVRTLIFAGAILVLALLGAYLQDRRKRVEMGEAWIAWEAQTSFIPQLAKIPGAGWRLWLVSVLVWLLLSWAHTPIGDVPAGVFNWL